MLPTIEILVFPKAYVTGFEECSSTAAVVGVMAFSDISLSLLSMSGTSGLKKFLSLRIKLSSLTTFTSTLPLSLPYFRSILHSDFCRT